MRRKGGAITTKDLEDLRHGSSVEMRERDEGLAVKLCPEERGVVV